MIWLQNPIGWGVLHLTHRWIGTRRHNSVRDTVPCTVMEGKSNRHLYSAHGRTSNSILHSDYLYSVTIRITNRCDFFCTMSLFPFSRLFPTCFGLLWAHHQGYLQLLFLCYHLVHAVLCWSSACVCELVCGGDFSVLSEYTEVTTTNQSADARRRSTKHCMNQMVA